MAILKKVAIGFGALIGLLLVVGLILPSSVSVSRTIVIAAAPEEVFPYLNNFENFNKWSPWAEIEPDAEYHFEGPAEGVGARVSWVGEEVGSGTQEITLSTPFERVEVALDFGSQGTADAVYEINIVEGGTEVTWGFSTDVGMNLVGRYFNLMMEKWVGGDYERGLANLKAIVESETE